VKALFKLYRKARATRGRWSFIADGRYPWSRKCEQRHCRGRNVVADTFDLTARTLLGSKALTWRCHNSDWYRLWSKCTSSYALPGVPFVMDDHRTRTPALEELRFSTSWHALIRPTLRMRALLIDQRRRI